MYVMMDVKLGFIENTTGHFILLLSINHIILWDENILYIYIYIYIYMYKSCSNLAGLFSIWYIHSAHCYVLSAFFLRVFYSNIYIRQVTCTMYMLC